MLTRGTLLFCLPVYYRRALNTANASRCNCKAFAHLRHPDKTPPLTQEPLFSVAPPPRIITMLICSPSRWTDSPIKIGWFFLVERFSIDCVLSIVLLWISSSITCWAAIDEWAVGMTPADPSRDSLGDRRQKNSPATPVALFSVFLIIVLYCVVLCCIDFLRTTSVNYWDYVKSRKVNVPFWNWSLDKNIVRCSFLELNALRKNNTFIKVLTLTIEIIMIMYQIMWTNNSNTIIHKYTLSN